MSENSRSFGKSLFFGDLPEDLVFPYPRLDLSEQRQVQQLLAELRRVMHAQGPLPEGPPPPELWERLRPTGLFGLNIPREYGGLGLSQGATCRVFQELAGLDASLALTLAAHLALGATAILHFGSTEQKARYLPQLARGERLCAFCLTEPLSGNDAASIRTRAYRQQRPDGGDRYTLTGSKLWVTNGAVAEVFVLFAQTEVLRDGIPVDRITAFLVERGPGLRSGAEEHKLGVRGTSTTALYLEDAQVPTGAVLGSIGGGFKVAMDTLAAGRLPLAAACVGMAKELVRLTLQHATSRRQFGRLISSFGMIKEKVAEMQTSLYAAESLTYLTSGMADRARRRGGESLDVLVESACCKVFASEMLWRVVQEALAVVGGAGHSRDYPYERFLRDSHAYLLFGGTNEILRCYIALTGLQGPGESFAKLADAIKFPLRGYGLVMDTLLDRVKMAAYGRTALTMHHSRLKKEAVFIEDDADALVRAVDRALRKHGRHISEMQYVQRRLADMAIDLMGMVAVVSRCSAALTGQRRRPGEDEDRELLLARGYCRRAHQRIRTALEQMNENDDELRKGIADSSYHGRPYPFDAVLEE